MFSWWAGCEPRRRHRSGGSGIITVDITVDEIPAGLWIRWNSAEPADPDGLAYAIPILPEGPAVVVSRPGDPPMRSVDVRRVIEAIPANLHDRLIATPYGDRPLADGELGAVLSAAVNRTLRVRTGLALHLFGRGRQIVTVDSQGLPTWVLSRRRSPGARTAAAGSGRGWHRPTSSCRPAPHSSCSTSS